MTWANFNFTAWPMSLVVLCVAVAAYLAWLIWMIRSRR